ncbi:UNVERIFIED_CONTAM: hypothetical protein HDU68_012397 [Siphonaria sp. JEL0065]|nr:hypothetical protein HDU68_012397 [Siphonaria sp. JEL0065]
MPGAFPPTPIRADSGNLLQPQGFPGQIGIPAPIMMNAPPPGLWQPPPQGMYPQQVPPLGVHSASEAMSAQYQGEEEGRRQLAEAQAELEKIQLETARAREALAEQQRTETEKARQVAVEEAERKLKEEKEQLEALKQQLNQMRSSAILKSASSSAPVAASTLAPPPPTTNAGSVTPRISQGNFGYQHQQQQQQQSPLYANPQAYVPPSGTPWLDHAYRGSSSNSPNDSRLNPLNTNIPSRASSSSPLEDYPVPPTHNPALETHSYPAPPTLSGMSGAPKTSSYSDYSSPQQQFRASSSSSPYGGPAPGIPSPSITPQPQTTASTTATPAQKPKKKWWFSKSPQPAPAVASSSTPQQQQQSRNSSSSAHTSHANTELRINQICEDATTTYRRACKRNHRALMPQRERDMHKRTTLAAARDSITLILENPNDVRGVLDALSAEFAVIDQDIVSLFETEKREALVRQMRGLKSGLLAAISAQVITDHVELQEQCALFLQPLREDLKQSVFYAGMGDREKRDLEVLANRIWMDSMKVFEKEVRDPVAKELDKNKKGSSSSLGGMGGRGGSSSGSRPVVTKPVASFSGGSGSGSSTWGRSSASSRPPVDDQVVVCLNPECGKKKVGYGQSKLFCSTQCEKKVLQEQSRAMANY